MKVYRINPKTGFREEINTDGNYIPKGWKKVKTEPKFVWRKNKFGYKYKVYIT